MKPILFVIALVLLFSCKKENSTSNTTTVTLGDCFEKTSDNANYHLCFDSLLEESRCPANANCIWQGAAKGKFRFTVNNQEYIIRLSTTDLPPYYRTDTTVAGYHLKLVSLLPYPVTYPVPQGPVTATVEITH